MTSRWAKTAVSLGILALLVWAARFWHCGSFGLYEDDYTRIPDAMAMTPAQLEHRVFQNFRHLSDHGLPLHGSLITTLSYLVVRPGGLRAGYFMAFLLVAANACLLYALLRRLHGLSLGLTGGIAYALFSADTTQAFITHAFGLQPSMFFILLAFHSYLSKRRSLAFALAALSLITYETVYPVFLAAPLLVWQTEKRSNRSWISHALVMGIMLLAITALRYSLGESRVAAMGTPYVVSTSLAHMVQGPLVSLGTYFYRPLQVLASGNREALFAAAVAFLPLAAVFSSLNVGEGISIWEIRGFLRRRLDLARLSPDARVLVRLGGVGLLMLVLAYPLTFTVRAYAISGRDTRVHFAAVLGASVVVAVMWTLVLKVLSDGRVRLLVSGSCALLFSLLLGYGFLVQKDYVMAWQYQKEFWRDLLPLVRDADEATAILIEPDGLPYTRQIEAVSWNVSRVLSRIYEFPASWEEPPIVYRLVPVWRERILTEDRLVRLNELTTAAPPTLYQTAAISDVILVDTAGGELRRREGPLVVGGKKIDLRADLGGDLFSYPKGILYSLLLGQDGN